MEFWDSKMRIDDSDLHGKMSSDDDDILKHVQNLDIGDNYMDDDDAEDSYDSDERGLASTPNGTNSREGYNRSGVLNDDYPDDLSDISDLFEGDAHLLNLDIGMSIGGASQSREVQMLSLDEVPYSRDLKWINTPEDDRPKPRIVKTGNRFLKQVQGITSQNQGELHDLDRHYRGLDQKKRDYETNGPLGSRDRRRGRTNGGLTESQFIPESEPLLDGLAPRGPGKLVIFDDDPKPSQRRKRLFRPRQARGDGRGDPIRGERDAERGGRDAERGSTDRDRGTRNGERASRDGGGRERGEWEQRKDQGTRSDSKESRDRGQDTQRGDTDSRSNLSNGKHQTRSQKYQASKSRSPRQENVAVHQARTIAARPLPTPTPTPTPSAAVAVQPLKIILNQRSVPFVPSQPMKYLQNQQQHLISETNAIKLRADAPVWTPPTSVYT